MYPPWDFKMFALPVTPHPERKSPTAELWQQSRPDGPRRWSRSTQGALSSWLASTTAPNRRAKRDSLAEAAFSFRDVDSLRGGEVKLRSFSNLLLSRKSSSHAEFVTPGPPPIDSTPRAGHWQRFLNGSDARAEADSRPGKKITRLYSQKE